MIKTHNKTVAAPFAHSAASPQDEVITYIASATRFLRVDTPENQYFVFFMDEHGNPTSKFQTRSGEELDTEHSTSLLKKLTAKITSLGEYRHYKDTLETLEKYLKPATEGQPDFNPTIIPIPA